MVKIKERGKIYALHKAGGKLNDYYGNAMLNVVQFDGHDIQCAYIDGYLQAEQDLEVKEVDLDFQRFAKEMEFVFSLPSSKTENTEEGLLNWEYAIAKHFFELGLNYKK